MDKQQILCDIAYIVVLVIIGVVSRYLIPFIKEKLGAEKYAKLENQVKTLVYYAEQVYNGKTGEEKLFIVKNELNRYLEENHINIDTEQVRQIIESYVREMKIASGTASQT